jgi:hypothetical protein
MDAVTVPAGSPDSLDILESVMGSLAGADPAELGEQEVARRLRVLERVDAIEAAVRGRLLEVFDAQDGSVSDGQRTTRTWLMHVTRVTRGQAGEHKAVQALAREHPVLLAALAEGWVLTKSVALQLAKWTRPIPEQYRTRAEEILGPPPGPARTCGRWRRSAPRSGTAPPGRTRRMRTTGTWTAACPWRRRSTAPASSAAT